MKTISEYQYQFKVLNNVLFIKNANKEFKIENERIASHLALVNPLIEDMWINEESISTNDSLQKLITRVKGELEKITEKGMEKKEPAVLGMCNETSKFSYLLRNFMTKISLRVEEANIFLFDYNNYTYVKENYESIINTDIFVVMYEDQFLVSKGIQLNQIDKLILEINHESTKSNLELSLVLALNKSVEILNSTKEYNSYYYTVDSKKGIEEFFFIPFWQETKEASINTVNLPTSDKQKGFATLRTFSKSLPNVLYSPIYNDLNQVPLNVSYVEFTIPQGEKKKIFGVESDFITSYINTFKRAIPELLNSTTDNIRYHWVAASNDAELKQNKISILLDLVKEKKEEEVDLDYLIDKSKSNFYSREYIREQLQRQKNEYTYILRTSIKDNYYELAIKKSESMTWNTLGSSLQEISDSTLNFVYGMFIQNKGNVLLQSKQDLSKKILNNNTVYPNGDKCNLVDHVNKLEIKEWAYNNLITNSGFKIYLIEVIEHDVFVKTQ
ncbi:hypothetical protein ABC345_21280 [Shouchella sp. 1P09AA]|uniref:hypothetical protein n=1 Tax=unclassified Shouchella TaxID=2893065 RepID=UPI00399FEECA